MVFVKVRETYDLHTTKNKMTVIAIHTPKPEILKRNYPGLLMQCRAYRPVSADVRIACASMLPLDPLGVGTTEGDVSPEDVFNPILYKAMSNKGMSQLEARITNLCNVAPTGLDVDGQTAGVDVNSVTPEADEFNIYYGLLANTHDWKHANPQAGLSMTDLRPFVYEMVYNVGDQYDANSGYATQFSSVDASGDRQLINVRGVLGKAKEFPFLNCTSYSYVSDGKSGIAVAGFTDDGTMGYNAEQAVPWLNVVCGCIIVPPSRLHELFFRMVVEWTVEFSAIRPLSEITDWGGIARVGDAQHYQNYSYTSTKEALTGTPDTMLTNDACMVSSNANIEKVM